MAARFSFYELRSRNRHSVRITSSRRTESKAAEDSRTPTRCGDSSRATLSARFWSAAVLCRFPGFHYPVASVRSSRRVLHL